ncbi:AraC family transcriptional regulator [Algicola sagamiensis]|uniref:AraC family transcriptional regulator n=1 Tax=Algicola sagamiensis TaxID=163869 RepID=UPI00037F267E|nr:AraC family transcriptional regulator [Algicola sagamiensis]
MKYQNRLAQRLEMLVTKNGIMKTDIPGLDLIRVSEPTQPKPVIYQPCIYVVAQGEKRAYVDEYTYCYDDLHYLILSVPLPLYAGVTVATEDEPFLALRLEIPIEQLQALHQQCSPQMEMHTQLCDPGIFITPLDEQIEDCFVRLLQTLKNAETTSVIAPLIQQELLFYLLKGPQGKVLSDFVAQDRIGFRISTVIHYIQRHYQEQLEVAELANIANMSPSTFFKHFKSVTKVSPIQYVKSIRLHQAKRMFDEGRLTSGEVAYQVGYSSLSQFSREYKRLFQVTPSASRNDRYQEIRGM